MTYLDYNDGRGPIPCDTPKGEDRLTEVVVDQLVRKHGWRYRIRTDMQTIVERVNK